MAPWPSTGLFQAGYRRATRYRRPPDCVLFLHTGGLPAILAYPDRLGPDVAAVLEPEVQLVKRSCGDVSQGRAARRGSDNPRSVGRCRVRT